MKVNYVLIGSLGLLTAACGSSGNQTSNDGGATLEGGASNDAGDGASSSVLGFTPSNFDPGSLGIDLTNLPDIDVTQGCSPIASDSAGFGCGMGNAKYALITQSNQIKVGVHVAHSWRIEPNAILKVAGPYPIILVAIDKIEILGALVAAGQAQFAFAGGFQDKVTDHAPGGGPGGGGGGNTTGAGGGGSYCGIGGSGANGGGAGGVAYGTPEIVPLTAGSSGGQQSGIARAGAGGGAIQLVAGNTVSVAAGASVNVGGGGAGTSAGGGSGGSLLIESQAVTIAGVLAANGGGGGTGSNSVTGTAGGDALASTVPAAGGTDASNNAPGGTGSAGMTVNGANGNATPMIGAGGGGGGAGRIRINTKSGSANLQGGTLSPDATTSCVTQGTLH